MITRPAVTWILTVAQTVYELVSTATPTTGEVIGNPTWKLFKPFTATFHTSDDVLILARRRACDGDYTNRTNAV